MNSHYSDQYDNPATNPNILGIIRYGVDNTTVPDLSLVNNPPNLPDGSPGSLDTSDLLPVGGGPAPDPTL